MARTRNLKPGFFTNEQLAELHPLTRILFGGLWCHADREGRLEDRPKKLKAEILPYDDHDVEGALNKLQTAGFILRYRNCEASYIQVLAFKRHQNPHVKEPPSEIPESGASTGLAPDKNSSSRASNDVPSPNHDVPSPNHLPNADFKKQKSLFVRGAEQKSAQTPAQNESSRVFLKTCKNGEEWEVPDGKIAEWEESFPDVDVRLTLLAIRQWLSDNPRKRKTAGGMVRWIGGWMRREQDKPDPRASGKKIHY